MDELAHAVGCDPYEYRSALLAGTRQAAVLDLAAARAGWGTPLPAGRARGIAVVASYGSVVAQVVEVSLQDGGPACTPSCLRRGLRARDRSLQHRRRWKAAWPGLSAALWGNITVANGAVEQGNFHQYRVLRMNEMPVIETHLVASSEARVESGSVRSIHCTSNGQCPVCTHRQANQEAATHRTTCINRITAKSADIDRRSGFRRPTWGVTCADVSNSQRNGGRVRLEPRWTLRTKVIRKGMRDPPDTDVRRETPLYSREIVLLLGRMCLVQQQARPVVAAKPVKMLFPAPSAPMPPQTLSPRTSRPQTLPCAAASRRPSCRGTCRDH